MAFQTFTILGSGSSVPHPHRSSSGYWLETTAGSLLLDCSASAVHRMAQENLDWTNLDAIWISHFHLDHIAGIAPFLFAVKYAPNTQNRIKILRIFGPQGLKRILRGFDQVNEYKLFEQRFPIEVIEIEPLEEFEVLPNISALAVKTPHTEESFALCLRDENEKRLVYSGDSGMTKVLGNAAQGVDLFVCECSFVKNKPVETHLELAEAIYLARFAKPKTMILTHLYAEWDEVDWQIELAKHKPLCEMKLAFDGLRYEF